MKNRQLIEELKCFNLDAEVSLVDSEDICISYIGEEGDTPQTTKHLFIEGCDLFEED